MSTKHQLTIDVPLPSNDLAKICHGSLSVDTEPLRGGCKKSFQVLDNHLVVNFEADQARIIRVSVGHFFELLSLVIKTIKEFGGEEWLKKPHQLQAQGDASTGLPS